MKHIPEDIMKNPLQRALEQLGADRVWRPVANDDGTLLDQGQGNSFDGIPADSPISFADKTVLDMGCNVGTFTFQAARRGARLAAGTDLVPEAIAVCNILREQNGLDNTAFFVSDILCPEAAGRYDMVLLVDIIGKRIIRSGRIAPLVRTMDAYAAHELVLTFRPVYALADAFGDRAEKVAEAYPAQFVREGKFLLYEYIAHLLSPDWRMQVISNEPSMERKYKYLFQALRVG
jgi:ribosomal protein L11 methyltransferase